MLMGTTQSLLSVKSAALRLGLSPHTIRKYVELRRLPFVKIGARVLFDPEELERYIDERRVPVE